MYIINTLEKEKLPEKITKNTIKNAEYRYSTAVKKSENIDAMISDLKDIFPGQYIVVFKDNVPIRLVTDEGSVTL
jgi:hypothetical protein